MSAEREQHAPRRTTALARLADLGATRAGRMRVYLGLACGFALLALATVGLKDDFEFAVSDGRFYYAYLPTLVVDGDLDLENQIREHWGPDFDPALLEDRTRRGLVHDKYPIGVALTLAPSFLAAHAASSVLHATGGGEWSRPDGYSVLYQLASLALVLALGLATFALLDRLLVERLGIAPRWAFLAIVLYWTGSHYGYYYFREPLMSHAISAFWVTAAVWLAGFRLDAPRGRRRAFLLALCVSMAAITRPTNAVVLLPFLLPLVARPGLLRAIPWLLAGTLPVVAQMAVWKVMHGELLHYGYHSEGFLWLSPALLSVLFSSKHGLLFWTPLVAFSLAGLILGARSGREHVERDVARRMVAAFVLLWYVNASWHQWWFGDAFGGRAFLALSFAFVAGLAWTLQAGARLAPVGRRVGGALLALCWLWTWVLLALYVARKIPRADYLF